MSGDLVERLRATANDSDGWACGRLDVCDEAADEIERLRAEVAAFRKAVVDGDGPSCEDVCQRECIGACGADRTEGGA